MKLMKVARFTGFMCFSFFGNAEYFLFVLKIDG